MGIQEKLPLINSEKKLTRIVGYVVYAFLLLMILGVIFAPPVEDGKNGETKKTSTEETSTEESTATKIEVEDGPGVLDEAAVKKQLGEKVNEKPSVSDDVAMSTIRTTLRGASFSDVTTQVADGRAKGGTKSLIMTYKSSASTAEDVSMEIGSILGAFLGTVRTGWDCDELSAVIGDSKGNAVGMWYCSKSWKEEYIKGTMTDEELILKVLGTIQSL